MSIIDIIKQQEGCRLKPYTDTTGHITIGYGRNLTDCGISQDEADLMLANDSYNSIFPMYKQMPWISDKSQAITKEISSIFRQHIQCKLTVEKESNGDIIIGYNRNLTVRGISKDEAIFMFLHDFHNTKFLLFKALPWLETKPENIRNALINMAFNVGVTGLLKFVRFLNALENNKIPEAVEALKFNADGTKTKYYTQVPSRVESICKMLIGKI
jgi:GH24 family phage-related lysozyme (muramidase)